MRSPAKSAVFSLLSAALAVGLAVMAAAGHAAPQPDKGAPPPDANLTAATPADPRADAADGGDVAATAESSALAPGVDWTKIPPIRPIARAGEFLIAPSHPGYFSLLDQLQGNYRERAPILPYGTQGDTTAPSYDVDYRYLDDPHNTQYDYLDPWKRIHLNDDWLLSFGGNFRVRTMHEVDSRFTTTENDYALIRDRLHADLWYHDFFRFYAEGIYADDFGFTLLPGSRDINRGDCLDIFADVKVTELDDGPVYFRGGRQEVTYGSRRLLGSRSWSNSRATWEGLKTFYMGAQWDADFFWLEPVIVHPRNFDAPDPRQNLYGVWLTRKIRKGTTLDFYYMDYDNSLPAAAAGSGNVRGPFNVHTLGGRTSGDVDHWLWDLECMLQAGSWANQEKLAAGVATGLGYQFADLPGQPQVWGCYDWASGTANPNGSTNQTFYQISPAVHYYFGALDLVGRQNIRDVHGQILFYPENWVTTIIQFHHFELDSPRDALYNAQGVATRRDPTGAAGRNVGNELDIHAHMHLATHSNIQVGWSKLFAGPFIAATGPNVSPELFYVQYNYRW